jgi:hypothetical protein
LRRYDAARALAWVMVTVPDVAAARAQRWFEFRVPLRGNQANPLADSNVTHLTFGFIGKTRNAAANSTCPVRSRRV